MSDEEAIERPCQWRGIGKTGHVCVTCDGQWGSMTHAECAERRALAAESRCDALTAQVDALQQFHSFEVDRNTALIAQVNGITDALEARGYVHMQNGKSLGDLLDHMEAQVEVGRQCAELLQRVIGADPTGFGLFNEIQKARTAACAVGLTVKEG